MADAQLGTELTSAVPMTCPLSSASVPLTSASVPLTSASPPLSSTSVPLTSGDCLSGGDLIDTHTPSPPPAQGADTHSVGTHTREFKGQPLTEGDEEDEERRDMEKDVRSAYSPLPWQRYFERSEDVRVCVDGAVDVFRVYRSGTRGPLLVLLHGGGHSALTWALSAAAICRKVTCRVLAMDLRGHGATHVQQSEDLSAQTMATDVANVVRACYGESPPPMVLIGHGVGGAIAVHAAGSTLLPAVVGLVTIDVVEGSARNVLHTMQMLLKSRPLTFQTVDQAIEWSVKSGQIRNLESARVSVIGQIKRIEETDTDLTKQVGPVNGGVTSDPNPPNKTETGSSETGSTKTEGVYRWRIDLSKAEKYWDGWFRGISNLFLTVNLPKLLLLAGVDRLDREMTIGQMQGKFMMQVLPPSGQAVHEDHPNKVAEAVSSYLLRHRFAETRRDRR